MAISIKNNKLLTHSRAEPKRGEKIGRRTTKVLDASCTDHADAVRCAQDRGKNGKSKTLRDPSVSRSFQRQHTFEGAETYYTIVDTDAARLALQVRTGDLPNDYERENELGRIRVMTDQEIELFARQEVQAKLVDGLWEVLAADGSTRTLTGKDFAAQYRKTAIPTTAKAKLKKD